MEEPSAASNCSYCNEPILGRPEKCISCGFPENGTEVEKSKFKTQKALDLHKKQSAPKIIKSATTSLYVIGAIQLLFGLYQYFANDNIPELIASGVVFIIFMLLGYWSQSKPWIALVIGLVVYAGIVLLTWIDNPANIYKGIVIKIFIVVYLVKGIISAGDLKKE